MTTRWLVKPKPKQENIETLKDALGVSEIIAHLLLQRGITDFDTAKMFFRPNLDQLHDPYLMRDMDVAVERVVKAVENGEHIMIYGDYDVDGTTSVALMYSYLHQYTENITFYIPDRYKEGYGISKTGIDYAEDNGVSLIIALDCGIKAIDKVAYANQKNIDFIICDHHLPSDELPKAIAVLDPKRLDCDYPFEGLSGCGVGFKLIQALAPHFKTTEEELFPYLDLVAVSIAADIVPLVGENRILTHYGLKQLNTQPRLGLSMLIPKESMGHVDVSKIVFAIAPKINAAGRIKLATDAVRLLIAENEITARKYVSEIMSLNIQRKTIDAEITESAIEQIIASEDAHKTSTVVYNPDWHKGVIGIVASRLTEVFYRPTVVFTKGEDGDLVASVRSVKGFDVYEAISACSDLLDRYGGHMYAAGLSMKEVNLPAFKRKFEQTVSENIKITQQTPTVEIDAVLTFDQINAKFLRILKQFQPFGPGNLAPQFLTKNVYSAGNERTMGKNNEHLKFNVFHPKIRKVFSVIAFGKGDLKKRIQSEPFDMVYQIEENIWQGKSHLQLRIVDIRFHE
ncbi:MAG: single-stranded-DNA-specific exonuclease RecJ [Weeksellaceae bacterium]